MLQLVFLVLSVLDHILKIAVISFAAVFLGCHAKLSLAGALLDIPKKTAAKETKLAVDSM